MRTICKHGTPVTVALDGWTNVNHEKVTNIVLLCGGRAFYWRSIVNASEHNTAAWLHDAVVPVLNELLTLGITFVAISMDNEATTTALFNLLRVTFPFLLRVACGAHVIQLIVRALFEHPTLKPTLDLMLTIISHIGNTKKDRLALANIAKTLNISASVLIKPNATRWNSSKRSNCIHHLTLS